MYTIENLTTTTDWTDDGPVKIYHFDFAFSSKEQYLEETAGWKAEYKELSKRIRQHKIWRKPKHRPSDTTACQNISTLDNLQTQARLMCQMRVQAKVAAGKQMVAQQQAA
jgi:hypothetical protein